MNNDQIIGWKEALVNSLLNLWNQIISYVPEIIGAIIVLIIGWLIAKTLGKVAEKILKFLKVDKFTEKIGLRKEMDELGFKLSLSAFFGKMVKWFFMIAALIAVADVLKIPQITNFLERLVLYLPNVIVAIIILLIGLVIGRLLHNLLHRSMDRIALPNTMVRALASAGKFIVFAFAFMAALVQLGIAASLIEMLFGGFVVMLALAGGLAFGLGGREHASRILTDIENNFRKR